MDLNRRPPPYKGGALTAELYARKRVGISRLERETSTMST